jgi:phage major head subunit gpT-like protein
MGIVRIGHREVIGRFYQRLEALSAEGWASRVAMLIETDQESEEYAWLGMAPKVREWVGGRMPDKLRETSFSIKNKLFEASIEVSIDDFRRDKTGQVQIRINELANRVAEHWHQLLTSLIIANPLCYDGQNFFDTDHSEGDSGTQLNALAAAQVAALDCTLADPTVDEIVKVIAGVITYMMAYKDDKGEPLTWNAKSFLFMVPARLQAVWRAAISTGLVIAGAASRENVLLKWPGLSLDVVVNPRLTDANVFYTFIDDREVKPFIMQNEFFEMSEKDDSFDNNRIVFGAKLLRNVGCGFWQYATKCTLS